MACHPIVAHSRKPARTKADPTPFDCISGITANGANPAIDNSVVIVVVCACDSNSILTGEKRTCPTSS
jgi:hypothetical protein